MPQCGCQCGYQRSSYSPRRCSFRSQQETARSDTRPATVVVKHTMWDKLIRDTPSSKPGVRNYLGCYRGLCVGQNSLQLGQRIRPKSVFPGFDLEGRRVLATVYMVCLKIWVPKSSGGCPIGFPLVSQHGVTFYSFLGQGSSTKIDYRKKGYPYSNLSTQRPSFGTNPKKNNLQNTSGQVAKEQQAAERHIQEIRKHTEEGSGTWEGRSRLGASGKWL